MSKRISNRNSSLKSKRFALQIALGMQVNMNKESIYGVLKKVERTLHCSINFLDKLSRYVKYLCLTIQVVCIFTGNFYEAGSLEILKRQVKAWKIVTVILKKQFPMN